MIKKELLNGIRTFIDPENGQTYYIAKDICMKIGIQDYRCACRNLHDGEAFYVEMPTDGGIQDMIAVTEGAMYRLILKKGLKPSSTSSSIAKRFSEWIISSLPDLMASAA